MAVALLAVAPVKADPLLEQFLEFKLIFLNLTKFMFRLQLTQCFLTFMEHHLLTLPPTNKVEVNFTNFEFKFYQNNLSSFALTGLVF